MGDNMAVKVRPAAVGVPASARPEPRIAGAGIGAIKTDDVHAAHKLPEKPPCLADRTLADHEFVLALNQGCCCEMKFLYIVLNNLFFIIYAIYMGHHKVIVR